MNGEINTSLDTNVGDIFFKNKINNFVSPTINLEEIPGFTQNGEKNLLKDFYRSTNVKFKVFKRAVGTFLSI